MELKPNRIKQIKADIIKIIERECLAPFFVLPLICVYKDDDSVKIAIPIKRTTTTFSYRGDTSEPEVVSLCNVCHLGWVSRALCGAGIVSSIMFLQTTEKNDAYTFCLSGFLADSYVRSKKESKK